MRRLYLVRHATPTVQPDVPSREWALSERGIDEARALAETAKAWDLRAVYCGDEPKMRSTALVLVEPANTPVHVVDAFNETRMVGWIGNSDEFNDLVRTILNAGRPSSSDDATAAEAPARPLPRGTESGEEAAARFEAGLHLIEDGAFPAAIVSGGRVLTSYLSRRRRGIDDAFAYWRAIPFPGWTHIDLDEPHALVPQFTS